MVRIWGSSLVRKLGQFGLAVMAFLALSQPAEAARDPRKAKRLYNEGVELFGQEQYEQARVKFGEAYELDPSPVLVFNQARAYEELGDAQNARRFYTVYLYLEPHFTAENRKEIEHLVAAYGAFLSKPPIEENASGALGLNLSDIPSVTMLKEIAYKAEEDGNFADAQKAYEAYLEYADNADDRVDIESRIRVLDVMQRNSKAGSLIKRPSTLNTLQSQVASSANAILLDKYRRENQASKFTPQEITGISLAGAGLFMLGLGTYFYVSSWGDKDAADEARNDAIDAYSAGNDPAPFMKHRKTAEDDMNRHAVLGYVFWGLGLATASSGAILWWLDRRDREEARHVHLFPTPGGAGLQVEF